MADKIIDPAPVIKRLANRCLAVKGMECTILGELIDMLHAAPGIDAVEVVPCQNCTNHTEVACPENKVWCKKLRRYMNTDAYCSYGERKNDG